MKTTKNSKRNGTRIGLTFLLTGALTLGSVLPATIPGPGSINIEAAQAKSSIELVDETYVTSGAKLKNYVWEGTRSGKEVRADAKVIEIDLQNPYVQLDVMTGQNGKFTTRATTNQMAQETKAVGGINGDFYGMQAEGAPIGPQVQGGVLVSSPSQLAGMYAFGITKDRKPVIEAFDFQGELITQSGNRHPLTGMNKTYYWTEPDGMHSHVNALYIYTAEWGSTKRADDGNTTPTEVLVRDGVVVQISMDQALPIAAPEDGYILRATHKAAEFIKANVQVGDTLQANYQLTPLRESSNLNPSEFQMLIGGHTLLVENGKASGYTRNVSSIGGNRARTGIAFSKDGRYVYMITVDRDSTSDGMSIGEFQQFMVQLGAWKGMMLDGGGSTQMVARPLGERNTQLVNNPEDGSARRVVNSIGVYTNAPQGVLKDFKINGKSLLLLGEHAGYELNGYDEYYNPISTEDIDVTWSVPERTGAFNGSTLTASGSGESQITATSNGVKRTKDIEVLGQKQVRSLQFEPAGVYELKEGATLKLPLAVVSESGLKRSVSPDLVRWEMHGFNGSRQGDEIQVGSITSPDGIGQVIAHYDGYSTMYALAAIKQREELFMNFSSAVPEVTALSHPAEVKTEIEIADDALSIRYDFSAGEGTKAAYAAFDNDMGLSIDGEPVGMKLDVKGDESHNWLRAEVLDASGKSHLVDITRDLNWEGWETLEASISSYNMVYPVKLKRIYVANPENGQENRAPVGQIAVDNIHFQYEDSTPEMPKQEIRLTVNKKTMEVGRDTYTLDQSPVVVKGRTLVPMRFVVDALGGTAYWDGSEKKVTLIRGGELVQLWIGDRSLNVNGERFTSDISPTIINGRTMMPLRLVSETFGWEVHWDQQTRTIQMKG